jgi:hypothetical protein
MSPETEARQRIDDKLAAAGWLVQDLKQLNPGVLPGRLRAERAAAGKAPVRPPSKPRAAAQAPA